MPGHVHGFGSNGTYSQTTVQHLWGAIGRAKAYDFSLNLDRSEITGPLVWQPPAAGGNTNYTLGLQSQFQQGVFYSNVYLSQFGSATVSTAPYNALYGAEQEYAGETQPLGTPTVGVQYALYDVRNKTILQNGFLNIVDAEAAVLAQQQHSGLQMQGGVAIITVPSSVRT